MKLRFIMALWAAKLLMLIYKIFDNERDDMPGLLAFKICPDFLNYIAKPNLVVGVTGTNGKTSVASLITDVLRLEGKSVGFNDWGANTISGHARCLLGTVNIFNKPVKDAAVLEIDEPSSPLSIPKVRPDYIVVTNVCRDSIRRNAHYDYVYNRMNEALKMYGGATLILNADDPISFRLGKERKSVYYSITKRSDAPDVKYNADDLPVCPECFGNIVYDDRKYRNIGTVHCKSCEFKSPEANYAMTDYDLPSKTCVINNTTYKLVSDNIFNAYNLLAVVAFLKEYGMSDEKIKNDIEAVNLPASRISVEERAGVEFHTMLTKGQNVSASSAVFEYLSTLEGNIELILVLNEVYGKLDAAETITWLYETDFEFLNTANIKRIVAGGDLYLDYKLRLLLAGIDEEKIVCVRDEKETVNYIDTEGVDRIYVLHEADSITRAKELRKAVMQRFEKEAAK